jgi:predicted RNA-binding Zn ribbon-like protein
MTTLPFKYVGGDPALDLINTVDWTANGPRAERLSDYGRFVEWAEGAGVVGRAAGARLRREARRRPRVAADALNAARRARETLQRALSGRAASEALRGRDLASLNRLLSESLARMEVASTTGTPAALGWRGLGEELSSPIWPVVWSAARLLTSDEADRIRVCAGDDCGWMYVDRSRNGLRRWCEMATCGTREKNRRRTTAG